MKAWIVFVFVDEFILLLILSMLTEGPPEPEGNLDFPLCFVFIVLTFLNYPMFLFYYSNYVNILVDCLINKSIYI